MEGVLGRYVVADPRICGGRPTFRGSRVLVTDVLEQVALGMDWDAIVGQWHDSVTKEAIAEAVLLARELLVRSDTDGVAAPALSELVPQR